MKQKVEIMSMTDEILSPITKASNVLLEDGSNVQQLIDNYVEPEFTPTIETSSSMSKVGQGDNVDFSANVINGAYESCVLKGKTLVNYNAEGNDRDEYVCMPSVEGQHITATDTIEGHAKSAILKGNTLVNIIKNPSEIKVVGKSASTLAKYEVNYLDNTKNYTVLFKISDYVGSGNITLSLGTPSTGLTEEVNKNGIYKFLIPSIKIGSEMNEIWIYWTASNWTDGNSANVSDIVLIEGDYTNVDIPYFEGMQSVKLPVLTTTGKNLFDGEIEIGSINNNGDLITNSNMKRPVNFTKVKGNTTYTFSKTNNDGYVVIHQYDKNKKFISYVAVGTTRERTFTTHVNTNFLKFRYESLSECFFQIEESSVATTYEPYKTNILTVNDEVTLRGIGEVRDELDLLTGELIQRIKETTLDGSESWESTVSFDDYMRFRLYLNDYKKGSYNVIIGNIPFIDDSNLASFHYSLDRNGKYLFVFLNKAELNSHDVLGCKQYFQAHPTKLQYELATESIKTVDLSDNHVYSYNDTTHYTCSSAEGSLVPTLSIEEGVKYQAIIKPSTKYSIVFNRTVASDSLTVDLGGATANVSSTTTGKTIVQITTLPTLSHNYVKFLGVGNAVKDVQVIEGDVADDVEYFEGMIDVENPIVTNTGKNLFDGEMEIGSIDNKGNVYVRDDHKRCVNFIPVKENTTYTISKEKADDGYLLVLQYDENKKFIKYNVIGIHQTGNFTTDSNTRFVKFRYEKVADNNFQIEEGSVATSYEPYKSNTITTEQSDGSIITLRKIGIVYDTLDLETGEYVQRIGEIVLDGSIAPFSINTSKNNTIEVNFGRQTNMKIASRLMCDKLPNAEPYNTDVEGICCHVLNGNFHFNILKSKIENHTKQGVVDYLSQNPITVQYELETPITTTIDLKQHPYAYKEGYINLSSNSEKSLTPSIEYSLPINRSGQVTINTQLVQKQQKQLEELESMIIANMVNTQYKQTLSNVEYMLGGE